MSDHTKARVVYAIVCGAGPAAVVSRLVEEAKARGWDIYVIATPAGLDFFDQADIEADTGHPVRSEYPKPEPERSRSLPHADAIVVAPATYNTINKWAHGISDTYALGILAEAPGLGIPIVALPFANTALAANPAFQRSVRDLREMGVRVLLGPGEWEPHSPGTGGTRLDSFPWHLALDHADEMINLRRSSPDPGS